jgi:hypothetical protein
MWPYPRRILGNSRRVFNYRLSRARRSVECAFEIMCSKRGILRKSKETSISNGIHTIVKAMYTWQLRPPTWISRANGIHRKWSDRTCDENCGQSQYRFSGVDWRREVFL